MPNRLPLVVSLIVFTLVSAGFILSHVLTGSSISHATSESGFIQMLSVLLWLIAAAGCKVTAFRSRENQIYWFLGGVILVLFALRELDIQKWLTDWNIGTPGNYLDATISLKERALVAVLLVIPSVIAILIVAQLLGRRFLKAWPQKAPWTRDVIYWLIMLVVSTRLDKIHHYMPALGVSSEYHFIFVVMEEVLEMVLALYVLMLLIPLWRRVNSGPVQQA